jgi:threonine synthase
MWKGFAELEAMGLIGPERPKMIVVQSTGCAPLVRAFEQGERHAPLWEGADTVAPGIRVPVAIGDYLILDAVRESGGTAIAVTDAALLQSMTDVSRYEGLFVSPESGAAFAAAQQLRESGFLQPTDEVVIFSTGSGLLHTELVEGGFPTLNPNDPNVGTTIDAAYPR